MYNQIINIDDFSGGMTLNDKLGRTNQFHIGVRCDFSSQPGKLAPGYGWVNMTESANAYLPDEISDMIKLDSANDFVLGGDDSVIYQQVSQGAVSAVATVSAGIKSIEEYGAAVFYTQAGGQVGTASPSDWSNRESAWNTLSNTSQSYYPFLKSLDANLYIGHKNDVAKVTTAYAFTDAAFALPANWKIRTMCDFGNLYVALGADYTGNTSVASQTKIFLWDRNDTQPSDAIILPEAGIKAMVYEAGYLWIWAGRSSNIYVVADGSRVARKIWSFSKENSDDIFEVFPNAVESRNGTIYFGLSDVGAESMKKNPSGIYSFPADPNNFSLNLVSLGTGHNSPNADDRFKSLGLNRSNSHGDMLFTSFYDSSATNKALLQREELWEDGNYADGCVYYSFRYEAPAGKELFIEAIGVKLDPLPAGTTMSLYYSMDSDMTDAGAGTWLATSGWHTVFATEQTDDITEKLVFLKNLGDTVKMTGKSIQFKLAFDGSTTTAKRPFVKNIYATGYLRRTNK